MMKNRLLFVSIVVAALSAASLCAQTPTKIESTNGLVDASNAITGYESSGVYAQAKTTTSPDPRASRRP